VLLKKLGKYEILQWLGGGRFGDVFLARDTILDKEFALKVSRMRKEEISMLKDEAKLLASLNHPNIVRFYNIDFIDNKFVLVMEYIKGQILRDIITQGGIAISEVVNIAMQILNAVYYAHSQQVLHRDLMPSVLPDSLNLVPYQHQLLARQSIWRPRRGQVILMKNRIFGVSASFSMNCSPAHYPS
jgi:serine/threonine protein kinase